MILINYLLSRRRWRDRGRAGDLLSEAGDLGLAVGQEALLAAQEQAAQEAEHARVGVQDERGDLLEDSAISCTCAFIPDEPHGFVMMILG